MNRLFGTDGVRGVANTELTPELAFNLGKIGTYVLGKSKEKPLVLIGKDTRLSGDLLENAITSGILSMGGNVINVGVLPTPAIAYLVSYMKADAGVVISASHNTYEFNGIKFFNSKGFKLDDDIEDEIEDIIVRDMDVNGHIEGDKLGRCIKAEDDAITLYGDFLKSTIDTDITGMKMVIDCANGASYKVAEKVLKDLGAEVIVMGNEPDGVNINACCGSTHPEALQKRVIEEQADIGLAFDGDADRLISVDEKGRIVDGDKMIYICAKMLKDQGKLYDDKVTVTVMSNLGFHKAIEKIGAKADVTQVGDRYVLESMLKTGCVIGGEQSGHIIFLNHSTTGDGILSALQLLSALKRSGRKLSELADEVTIYPQVLKNARIKNENKRKYDKDPEIAAEIKRVEEIMAGEGRVLIRPSGTEPLVRVMLEGKDVEVITKLAEGLATLLTKRMG
ncbi:MAG: phosphoglucosamine mutase [Clostridiales bacterium]|nr:phosphoglucosamine mutase [Clostridiales bacterium]